ncbi:MAG TPA: cell wall hydrolase [Xanthobacteraceae bacterium]|nr:cell wall hydrolase [Xanthobacteraceae bacterium]
MTTSIGYQDIAALMAQQPQVAARARLSLAASPLATIRATTISLPQPLGTAMPPPPHLMLASYDPGDQDFTGSIRTDRHDAARAIAAGPLVYPTVDRNGKGDRLIPRWGPRPPADIAVRSGNQPDLQPVEDRELQREVLDAIAHDRLVAAPSARPDQVEDLEAAIRFEPFPEYDISLSLEAHPQVSEDTAELELPEPPDMSILDEATNPDATARTTHLFFGSAAIASTGSLEPWRDGEEPMLVAPDGGDIKQAALAPIERDGQPDEGVTVAGKGEVTGDGHRPKSPAEHLGLAGEARNKAERCLTNAIYFEARGESVRGQIAVAQVVLNRALSGYYPHDVCGVVYQNAQRHLACQFTFACDGRSKAIHEPDAFERAKRISKAALDGNVWLPQVGKATHYHAYWVHPGWTRGMAKLDHIGVHTFYRPRNWGDGADKPAWGTPQSTAEIAAKL